MFRMFWRRSWPFLVMILLVAVFFWKFFLKGLIPIPADITVGMYYPWLDYKWGYAVGVPVKNPILSDVVSVIYPIKNLAIEMLKERKLPLWNSYMFAGYPLLANFQIALFNPVNILFFLLPGLKAWGMQIILQPLLIGLFTYLLLHHLKLSKFSSLIGAMIYSFSGFAVIWLEWGAHAYTIAYLPLLLLLTDLYFFSRKVSWGILLSIALAIQIFSGYPQVVLYSLLALLFFVLILKKIWSRTTIFWILWLALGVALAGIQLIPAGELFLSSQRVGEVIEKELAYLPWQNLISFFAPDYFGNHATMNFWGKGNYTNNVGYSGIISLMLSGIAIIVFRRERIVWFLVWLLLVSLALALPTPLALLTRRIGLGLGAVSSTRILFLVNFSLACLSAFALDHLRRSNISKLYLRTAYLPAVVIGGLALGTFIALRQFMSLVPMASDQFSQTILIQWQNQLSIGLRNLILPGLIILVYAFLIMIQSINHKIVRKIGLCLLSALIVFELFRFGWKYTPFSDKNLVFPTTPVIEFLQQQPGIFRVDGGNAIPMNMWLPYNLESLSAYDAVYPERIAKYIAINNAENPDALQGRYGQIERYNSPLIDIANICFITSVKRDEASRADPGGRPEWMYRLNKLESVFDDKTVEVLRNRDCLDRAFLIREYEVYKKREEIVSRLLDKNFDISKTVILEVKPTLSISGGDSFGDKKEVIWVSYDPSKRALITKTKTPALLFVSDSYYPGWKAFVDGQETSIIPANLAFRAIAVPAGEHQITFIYDPLSFKIGVGVSFTALFVLGGLFVYEKVKSRRASRRSPPRVLSAGD